jgi:peptidoglycan/LPS O-acetylase OafA/YrhL
MAVSIRNPFQSVAADSSAYRADIDGLRAIAVLAVVLYHAGAAHVGGGFVGVDLFFVISGYLIAGSIQHELEAGAFTFSRFYERRVRRILPALAVTAFAVVGVAGLIFPPEWYADLGRSLAAMTVFVSNIFFINDPPATTGYFAAPLIPQPLLHTWSLSVEEQFYFFFPALLMGLFRLRKRTGTLILALLFAASFTWSVWGVAHQPIATFYLLPPRAWEFLVGVLLATAGLPALNYRPLRELLAVAGLAAVLYPIVFYSTATTFPGQGALLPCFGAGLLIYTGARANTLTKSVLRFPPLVYVGVISYSLYLWHWPVIVFMRYIRQMPTWAVFDTPRLLHVLLLSLLLAVLSHQFVELPFRQKPWRISKRTVLCLALASSAALFIFGLVDNAERGLPGRFDQRTQKLIEANEARTKDFPVLGVCSNYQTDPKQLSDVFFCQYGSAPRNILFWGDSHVQQLAPLIEEMPREPSMHGEGTITAVASACIAAEHLNSMRPGFHCDAFTRFAMQRALMPDVEAVFLEMYPWWLWTDNVLCISQDGRCLRSLSKEEALDRMMEELAVRIRTLRQAGKRVILGLPFPAYDKNVPDYEIASAILSRFAQPPPPKPNVPGSLADRMRAIAAREGAEIYDPRQTLCPAGRCFYQIDGVSIYLDTDHVVKSRIALLKQGLLESVAPPAAVERNSKAADGNAVKQQGASDGHRRRS